MLNIVYEDKDILVINKPAGLLTHATTSERAEESLVDMLKEYYPPIEKVGEDLSRPGIVHRLDKDTSGLLAIAKNNEAFKYLKKLFQERKIVKRYYALVHGIPKSKEGTIDLPIARLDEKQTTKLTGKKTLEGKSAVTAYKVLREFKNYTLLEVTIKTGRTHQIRVHLKAIGHPIVCDSLYGRKKEVCPANLKRIFLHAFFLGFTTMSGSDLALELDLPEELSSALEKI